MLMRSLLLAAALAPLSATALEFSPDLTRPQAALPLVVDGQLSHYSTRVLQPAAGLTGVRGRSASGERLSLFMDGERILSGDVYGPRGHYRLQPQGSGSYQWKAIADLPRELTVGDFAGSALDVQFSARTPMAAAPPVAAPAADGLYEIDVLVLVTPLYAQRYGNGLNAEVQRLLFLANGYFENSQIPARYRLVGLAAYDGTSEASDFHANRDAIAQDPNVAGLRNQVQADLVALLRTMDGTADLCGLASGFNGAQRGAPGEPDNLDADRDVFSVSGMGPSIDGMRCSDYVLAHELAHDLSAGHGYLPQEALVVATGGAPSSVYWRPYAHGTVCSEASSALTYQSIMAALPVGGNVVNIGVLSPDRRVRAGVDTGDYFSNPDLMSANQVCGLAGLDGLEASQTNNARSITEAAPYVAAYRGAQARAVAAPSGDKLGGGAWGASLLLLLAVAARRARLH